MRTIFDQKNILLLISGGIASYKMTHLARQLIKRGARLRVAMTPHACEFISPLTFETLTKERVIVDDYNLADHSRIHHIEWAQWADICLLAPATANSLAKLAHGLADNFVSTVMIASPHPLFIVPAMNDKMYNQPANQRNIEQLKKDGHFIMEPAVGDLAEGYVAKGRLPEIEDIISQLDMWLESKYNNQSLAGKKILVSSGGTKERIDPVRYIGNDSSGRMGLAVAEAASELGGQVTLVTTSSLQSPHSIKRIQVESAKEMYQSIKEEFPYCDALVMAAAVADYSPVHQAEQKIKKEKNKDQLTIQLKKNPDILQAMAKERTDQLLVGFAAETQDLEKYARDKLNRKGLDMIVANDVSDPTIGFNSHDNAVLIIRADGQVESIHRQSKKKLGYMIAQQIADLL